MNLATRILAGTAVACALSIALAGPPHAFLDDLKRRLHEPRFADGDVTELLLPYLPQGASAQAAKQFCINIGAVVVDVPKEPFNRGPYYWCWRDTADLRKPNWGKRELVIAIYYQKDQVSSIVAMTIQKVI